MHGRSQRWFHGRDSYRPSKEPIRPVEFTVEPIARMTAKRFVERHHYSGTFVYEFASFGLWHKQPLMPAQLVGVASFATPSNPHSMRRWAGLDNFRQCGELGRFVLLDQCAGNAETFFLARALRGLKETSPEIRVVLSYSDPMPRRDLIAGRTRFIGHYGSIYQSSNALYLGRGKPKTLYLGASGEAIPNRILTKLRNGEDGAEYAQDRLERLAGARRTPGESADAFIARALASPGIRRARHPGNHLYLFPVASNRREKAQILSFPTITHHMARRLPYPKSLEPAA